MALVELVGRGRHAQGLVVGGAVVEDITVILSRALLGVTRNELAEVEANDQKC